MAASVPMGHFDPPASIRVLVADDHTILRQGVRLLLEGEADMEVVGEAADGKEAVRLARELRPDIIVMDISMPVMGGLEATLRIREEDPEARVLILTMHNQDQYVLEMLDAGVSGYVLKDSAADDLVKAVRNVIKGESVLDPSLAGRILGRLRRSPPMGRFRSSLTPREETVVRLVASGLTNRQIANRLAVSLKTVQTHRSHVMTKLGLHDRVDLVKYAMRHGLCDLW